MGHGARYFVDPFAPTKEFTKMDRMKYDEELFGIFDAHLKAESGQIKLEIRYYTYGIIEWRTTTLWPPAYIANKSWYESPAGSLLPHKPKDNERRDTYQVDYTATTGSTNRWMAQLGEKVEYHNRKEEDEKLQTYTSLPLDRELEVTGSPTVTMFVSSTHRDGAFHVYLPVLTFERNSVYPSRIDLPGREL